MNSHRFFGRYERLESREVLSATLGPLTAGYEMVDGSLEQAVQQNDFNPEARAAYVESLTDGKANQTPFDLQINFRENFIWMEFSRFDNSMPPRIQSSEPSVPPPIAAKSSDDQSDSSVIASSTMSSPPSTDDPLWLLSSLSNAPAPTITSASASESEVVSKDAVFQEYWSEEILKSSTSTSDREVEDYSHLLDEEEDEEEDITASGTRSEEEAEASDLLSSVKEEIAGIKAVLKKLKLLENEGQSTEDLADEQNVDRAASTVILEAAASPVPDRLEDAAPAARPNEGGMVILQLEDTSDKLDIDLTAIFANRMERASTQKLSVEATVHVYQAFDVGVSPVNAAASSQNKSLNSAVPQSNKAGAITSTVRTPS